MNILQINSSVSGEKPVSRQLTKATAHEVMRRSPNAMLMTGSARRREFARVRVPRSGMNDRLVRGRFAPSLSSTRT